MIPPLSSIKRSIGITAKGRIEAGLRDTTTGERKMMTDNDVKATSFTNILYEIITQLTEISKIKKISTLHEKEETKSDLYSLVTDYCD